MLAYGITTLVVDLRITTVFTVDGTSVNGITTGEVGNKNVGGNTTVITGETEVTIGVNVTTTGGGVVWPVGTEIGINEVGNELGMMVVVTGLTTIVCEVV